MASGRKLDWHPEQVCIVCSGARGSGKSSTFRALITSRNPERRIFFDPKRDFSAFAEKTVTSVKDMLKYLADVENDWPFSVSYIPKDLPRPLALASICREAERLQDCTVIADELHSATKHHEVDPFVIQFVRECRHSNCGFWGASQQPHDVSIDIRSQLNSGEAFYMLLVEKSDLDVLRARRGKEFADRVQRLPPLHGFRLQPTTLEPEPFRVDPRGGARLLSLDGLPLHW